MISKVEALLIGCSTGGPKALNQLLPDLCKGTRLPILIVQHMPPLFTQSLAESLQRYCSKTQILEAKSGMAVEQGKVYLAPGGQHMLLKKAANGQRYIYLNQQEPEHGCRPSVDVLFRSAVPILQHKVIAMVLTGMGHDGTAGAAALKRAGATIIVQDEESSVVWGMPGSVYKEGLADEVVSLDQMSRLVLRKLGKTQVLEDKCPVI